MRDRSSPHTTAATAATGTHAMLAIRAPAVAVPAEPAAIFRAPTQMNTCPRASAGAYSLRAASVAAKKKAFAAPVPSPASDLLDQSSAAATVMCRSAPGCSSSSTTATARSSALIHDFPSCAVSRVVVPRR